MKLGNKRGILASGAVLFSVLLTGVGVAQSMNHPDAVNSLSDEDRELTNAWSAISSYGQQVANNPNQPPRALRRPLPRLTSLRQALLLSPILLNIHKQR